MGQSALASRSPSSWSSGAQYALALGTIALALVLRWLLDPLLGPEAPFMTVFAVLLILVLLVRPGPFFAATAAAWLGILVLFVEPRVGFGMPNRAELVQLGWFGLALVGAGIAASLSNRMQARRREAEAELLRRGEELRLITDAMPALISYVDADRRYRFVNAAYDAWFGRGADEILGRSPSEVFGEAAYERVRDHIDAALAGRRCRFEGEGVPDKDGEPRQIVADYVPDIRPDGTVAGFFGLVTDVTAHKRAEAAQARLAAIVETSADAIMSIATDGRILTWNAGAERLFGHTAAEAVGRTIDLILPPGRADEERAILEQVRLGQAVGPYDTVRRAKDGRLVDVSISISPIRDAAGRIIGASKVDRDITERKQAERELRATRARERSYLEHLPVGVWFANERGELTYVNEAGRRIWAGAELVGLDDFETYEAYWHGTDRRIGADDWALARVFRGGETSLGEKIDIRVFDGSRKTILNSAVPVRDGDGAIVGAVVMNLDITAQKRAQQALEEADRRKDEFLATLAHELRNPLAAIRAAVDLLAHGAREGEQLDRITAIIQRQVALMVRLIDDLLDVSRITHGILELRRERASLPALVDQAIDAARPLAERKSHALIVTAPAEAIEVEGDAVRLIQVFTNLLNNACNYTDPGGRIEVRVGRDGGEAIVEIRDDGIGIPRDKLEAIFEMFSQLDSPGRGHGGLGIGLTLSLRLVEMHGGTLSAASDGPGRGSTFTVRLPAIAAAAAVATAPSSAGSVAASPDAGPSTLSSARRVLVVDDNLDAAESLMLLLTAHGHEVRTAHDGGGALAEAAAFAPEVILLDLGLPDISGVEVGEAIRAQPWGRAVLIVALSGWGQDRDKQRTAAAGFDAHLTKPADLAEVLRLVGAAQGQLGEPS